MFVDGGNRHDVLDDGMGVNNPEVLCKAHSEIERNIQQGILLDESNLPKLQYLNCIINETLRLYPVVLLLIPHFSSEECTVGGYNVPSGTMLITNAWAIHRDPKVWWNQEDSCQRGSNAVKGIRGTDTSLFRLGLEEEVVRVRA
ncbi:hypothetical protein GIB67_025947 [Kingdonia uniflora]|uniref:Cytochrome P450 n=1 Tax=Kingdonia uniflora TaxID=39325 RepID=A0A7J7PBS4_9MAGN|nr:hypothetical protein GIB67_025947 [Kingdonia uniflora]